MKVYKATIIIPKQHLTMDVEIPAETKKECISLEIKKELEPDIKHDYNTNNFVLVGYEYQKPLNENQILGQSTII